MTYGPGYLELETYIAMLWYGADDRWRAHTTRRNPDGSITVRGAIATLMAEGVYVWRRPLRDELSFTIKADRIGPVKLEYQRDTGKCVACLGRGKVPRSWSEADGTTLASCGACRGSGLWQPDDQATP